MYFDSDYRHLFNYDTTKLQQLCSAYTEADWSNNDYRQQTYEQHKHTQSIIYIFNKDETPPIFKNVDVHVPENYDELSKEVYKVANLIKSQFSENSKIVNLMLAKLPKHTTIKTHKDSGSLAHVHRCHLPIITNDECNFIINSHAYHFDVDAVVEINNIMYHRVYAGNADRIHLICDIYEY